MKNQKTAQYPALVNPGQRLPTRHRALSQRIAKFETPVTFSDPEMAEAFWAYFVASHDNENTRLSYQRAAFQFADWMDDKGYALDDVNAMAMGMYREYLTRSGYAPATVQLRFYAVSALFQYLVGQGLMHSNPCNFVKTTKEKTASGKGKTSVPEGDTMRHLFESIDTSTLSGLRDRAMMSIMLYSFARISAVCSMKRKDYYQDGKQWRLRFMDKGTKFQDLPAHHLVIEYLDAYLDRAGSWVEDPEAWLIQSSPTGKRQDELSGRPMTRHTALNRVKARSAAAGLGRNFCNHSFRGTGITAYLKNGGMIERAATMAGHASTNTTRLYDRRDDATTQTEVERIIL